MSLNEPFEDLELAQWEARAKGLHTDGYRLVQMTGTARDDHFEVMASYDKDYRCVNLRTRVPRENPELPSLSGIFPAAFTYENELKDLFGFHFPGLIVDYGGGFLRTKTKLPFTGSVTAKKQKPGPARKDGAEAAVSSPET